MKKIICVILALCMALTMCACGKKSSAQSWQEQYDLGVKYLDDGNYDEAVVAFTAAIKIDPKRAEAYEKIADAYVALGDYDNARKALEDGLAAVGYSADLRGKLEELEKMTAMASEDAAAQLEQLIPLFEANDMEGLAALVGSETFTALSAAAPEGGVYTGDRDGGLPSGMGVAVYPDQFYYYGSWENGHRAGSGKWFYLTESQAGLYVGEWANDKPNGAGSIYTKNIRDLSDSGDGSTAISTTTQTTFKDGLYSGQVHEVWKMNTGDTHDWIITAVDGVYQPISVSDKVKARSYYQERVANGQYIVAFDTLNPDTDLWSDGNVNAVWGFRPE